MSDMRNFLGVDAHSGQQVRFLNGGGAVGGGELTTVAKDQVKADCPDLSLVIFKGRVVAEVVVTGEGQCTVKLWVYPKDDKGTFHQDDQATYKDVNNTREVYCGFFPAFFRQVSIVFWRDGRYSNIKVWGQDKVFGKWAPIVHVWAHPKAESGAAGEPAQPLHADLEPEAPSAAA